MSFSEKNAVCPFQGKVESCFVLKIQPGATVLPGVQESWTQLPLLSEVTAVGIYQHLGATGSLLL